MGRAETNFNNLTMRTILVVVIYLCFVGIACLHEKIASCQKKSQYTYAEPLVRASSCHTLTCFVLV